MTYIPINNLNLNFTQIGIPAQTYSSANTILTLSGNINNSDIFLSGNNIILPPKRSYFLWGSIPFQGSSASDNPGIGIYNISTSLFMTGSIAYQYYPGDVTETHYTGDINCMLIDTNRTNTLQIKDVGGLGSTVTIYNNNSLRSDSNLFILYTNQLDTIPISSSSLVALTGISQLTTGSLNKYHSYSLSNTGHRYFPPTTPTLYDVIGFIHLSGAGNFAVEYPANSGTFLTSGYINSASTRKTFIFQWNGTTWVDLGQFVVV